MPSKPSESRAEIAIKRSSSLTIHNTLIRFDEGITLEQYRRIQAGGCTLVIDTHQGDNKD